MFDPKILRNEGSKLSLEKRKKSFDCVELEFTKEEAQKESSRCLSCLNPTCVNGCPLHLPIKDFIKAINEDNIELANKLICNKSPFTSICAKVCDHAKQCEGSCIRNKNGQAVRIGKLHSYVMSATEIPSPNFPPLGNKKVAIIGAGPSGLTVAYKLRQAGINVTIYEKEDKVGGIPVTQIPSFRLEKLLTKKPRLSIEGIKVIKSNINYKDILNQYDAIFLGIGTHQCKKMNIEGENLKNVILSNEYLKDINLGNIDKYKSFNDVFVIGGGNVALDCVRSAIRINDNVNLVYRRSISEAPGRKDEIEDAIKEGVNPLFLTNPIRFIGDSKLEAIELINMKLGEIDSSNRATFHEIEGSNHIMKADLVILAISSSGDPSSIEGLDSKYNLLLVNNKYQTSNPKVFAAGDIVTGPKTIVHALADALKASDAMLDYLSN